MTRTAASRTCSLFRLGTLSRRKTCEPISNRARQDQVPVHSRRVDQALGAGDRSSFQHGSTDYLLPGIGTERFVDGALAATALVIDQDGSIAGFQDKVQIDVSEEGTYTPGSGRRVFQAGKVVFGVAICHEGWRYPETVRWAARHGAHVVFHPHFHEAEPGSYRPTTFGDPASTFHERAALCRAAENTCYFATINCASPGSPTTSAIVRPVGTLLSYQPYGEEGLLIADIDISTATGFLGDGHSTLTRQE